MSTVYPIGADQGANIINILDSIGTSLSNIRTNGIITETPDVIEGYMNQGHLYSDVEYEYEIIGEAGKIYIDLLTNTTYRWSGTAWVSISNPVEIATQAEAEEGIDNTKMMTPLRVAQAIASLETRIAALEAMVQTTSVQSNIDDDYLVLTGNGTSESDDYLTITDSNISVSDDYLVLSDGDNSSAAVSNDYLTLNNASLSNGYLTMAPSDANISNDYLQL